MFSGLIRRKVFLKSVAISLPYIEGIVCIFGITINVWRPRRLCYGCSITLSLVVIVGPDRQRRKMEYWFVVRFSLLVCCSMEHVSAQIKYSIAEEVKAGSVVGNVARDLGLEIGVLKDRRFRIVSGSNDALFDINQDNGVLYVHKPVDREELCSSNAVCSINLKIMVENPLEINYVGVEITDRKSVV